MAVTICTIDCPDGIIRVEEVQSDDWPGVRTYLNDVLISDVYFSYEYMRFEGQIIDEENFKRVLAGEAIPEPAEGTEKCMVCGKYFPQEEMILSEWFDTWVCKECAEREGIK